MSDPVGDYLKAIGRIPLLTPAEEIELGHAVKQMMALLKTERTDFTRQEKLIIRRGKKAKERMITGNLRLVVSCAKKYAGMANSLELLDLIQEGNIGLNRAVELFDPERGYKFSTYSFWWIRQGIMRATLSNDRLLRLPAAAVEALRRLRSWQPRFEAKHGRLPTIAECAKYCKVTEAAMLQYLNHPGDCLSLDRKVQSEDTKSALIDLIADYSYSPEPEEHHQAARLRDAVDKLTDVQKHVVSKYYCLDGDKDPTTFDAIGEGLGLSRQSVMQHKNRALQALKTEMERSPGKPQPRRRFSSLNWSSNQAA